MSHNEHLCSNMGHCAQMWLVLGHCHCHCGLSLNIAHCGSMWFVVCFSKVHPELITFLLYNEIRVMVIHVIGQSKSTLILILLL